MTPLNRARVSPYQYFIATMSLSCTVSEIFSVKSWHDLEIQVRDRPRSLKVPPFDRSLYDLLLVYLVPFSSYLTFKNIVTLKCGLEVTQDHWKWYRSKAWYGFFFAFYNNNGHILYHFRDKARYWSKIAFFHTPPEFDDPVRWSPSEYCHKI